MKFEELIKGETKLTRAVWYISLGSALIGKRKSERGIELDAELRIVSVSDQNTQALLVVYQYLLETGATVRRRHLGASLDVRQTRGKPHQRLRALGAVTRHIGVDRYEEERRRDEEVEKDGTVGHCFSLSLFYFSFFFGFVFSLSWFLCFALCFALM